MGATTHGLITAGQVVKVIVNTSYAGIEVINRDMTGEIWVRFDGTDPSPRGIGSYVVIGTRRFPSIKGATEVRLTSESNRNFSVEGDP